MEMSLWYFRTELLSETRQEIKEARLEITSSFQKVAKWNRREPFSNWVITVSPSTCSVFRGATRISSNSYCAGSMQLLWVTDPQRVNESQNIPLGDAEAADELIWSDRNMLPSSALAWVMQATMTCDGSINLNAGRELLHDFNDN